MNQNAAPRADIDALLRTNERHQRWECDARRQHTKGLFGLWLLPVLGFAGLILGQLYRDKDYSLITISLAFLALIVLTGSYVFQEVARVHKRIEAILKLSQERERE